MAAKRKRERKDRLSIDGDDIAQRVVDFHEEDSTSRTQDIFNRLQRYAKFRMWTEGKDWPWEGASDAAIPDMMTHSLKVQDTLHNAVMSTRPSVIAKALQKAYVEREETVNDLLDFQFFVENKGELIVGEMADAFVNDGIVTVYVPWVKEERETHRIHRIPRIPDDMEPEAYFAQFLDAAYRGKLYKKVDTDGWSWEVQIDPAEADEWVTIDFYTSDDEIEVDERQEAEVFNAPRPIVKDYEDVLAPVRCANLQIPSPSNPGGAAHVILVDYPSIDEIERLRKSGYYDFPAKADEQERLERAENDSTTGQEEKIQKDAFQGSAAPLPTKQEQETPGHKTLTRLMCFDIYDIDGDGVAEDVIFWVIKETKTLLKVRELTQVYPANPPRRPFAEASFLPVRGRRAGISLLEQMEGLHDLIKQFADQTIDGGTIANVPFFFYRASSNMRPETIRLWPGEGYPLADPKNDVNFPSFPQQGNAFGMNLMQMFGQMEERLTNIGDLQLGRVPQGKASALRTVRGMNAVMGQGEARPERILRRFFMCLSEVFAQMHELNKTFLPREKQYRVLGVRKPNEDPFRTVSDPSEVQGRFAFDFTANAMNTSKEALQQSLDHLMAMYLNPLALQLGIIQPDGAYALLRDAGRAQGQDPDKYLTPPTPDANVPKLFAEEVISLIMSGALPEGRPAEAAPMEHMQKLMEFSNNDSFGFLTPEQVQLFKGYLAMLRQRIQAEQQKASMMQAATQFQQGQQGGAMPGPEGQPPDMAPAQNQPNKLNDMTLPGAGGGANQGVMQ